jgi:hypothetical protein
MKVTTVRFGADLWRLLEAEAAYAGISVSQYIREAALARAAAVAARGHGPFELLAGGLREVMRDEPDAASRVEAERTLARLARLTAADTMSDSRALRAQSKRAQARSKKAHRASETVRRAQAKS